MSIGDDIRVLSYISRKPRTSEQLTAWWRGSYQALEEALIALRDGGAIACANGVWFRRTRHVKSNQEKE